MFIRELPVILFSIRDLRTILMAIVPTPSRTDVVGVFAVIVITAIEQVAVLLSAIRIVGSFNPIVREETNGVTSELTDANAEGTSTSIVK